MSIPKNSTQKEHSTITSLELAEMAGKPHNDLLKAIRKMEPVWTQITEGKFSLIDYTDSKGRAQPVYVLKKTEYLYISSKFSDEIRARLVLRWEELERNLEQRLIAKQAEEREKLEGSAVRKLNQPKGKRYTTSEIALILDLNYHETCDYLVSWGIQERTVSGWKSVSDVYATPYLINKLSINGVIIPKTHLLWTEMGLEYILHRTKRELDFQDKERSDEYIRRKKAALGMS